MCLSDSTTSKFRRLRLSSQCYASLSQMRDLINRCLSSGFFLSMSSTLNALKCRIHKKMFCPIKWPQNMNTAVHDLSLPEWLSKPAGKTPMCLVCVLNAQPANLCSLFWLLDPQMSLDLQYLKMVRYRASCGTFLSYSDCEPTPCSPS